MQAAMAGGASVMRVKRRRREDFPCDHWYMTTCFEGCPGSDSCQLLVFQREYLALQRCARLLRVFERRVLPVVRHVFYTYAPAFLLRRLRVYGDAVSAALREAGLQ